ncbi:MAG: hypothetical protein H6739_35635 [Alphaproteobacteria bacterium]|nr:hypothetical protein [Alphaproteobacteria bacterium]
MPLLLALLSCTTAITSTFLTCEVDLAAVEPAAALPGDAITLTAGPLTESWDTAVLIGSERAEVVSLDRTGCEECDSCRVSYACDVCSDCDACDALCVSTCVETVTVLVPDLGAGPTAISMFNTHGGSKRLDFTVLSTGGDDTGDTAGDDTADTSGGDSDSE